MYGYLTRANLQSINNSWERRGGDVVFPNLADANKIKQSLVKSHDRYMKSTNHANDGITRYGSRGNEIKWNPLDENFSIYEYLQRKPESPPYDLPKWTSEIYRSQFGNFDEANFDEDANPNGGMPELPPLSEHVEAYGTEGVNANRSVNFNVGGGWEANALSEHLAANETRGVVNHSIFNEHLAANAANRGVVNHSVFNDRNVGDGWVDLAVKPSIIRQGECHEGEVIDFTLQLQMCPTDHVGTTGPPFNVYAWRSTRGAVDSKQVAHDTMSIFVPCDHFASSPLLKDKKYYPRFDAEKTSIICYIRGEFYHSIRENQWFPLLHLTISFLRFIGVRNHEFLPSMLEHMVDQLGNRLSAAGETIKDSVAANAEFLYQSLNAVEHARVKNKEDVISFRLVLPDSIQGALGIFQSKKAIAFQESAVSPEIIMIHGSIDSDIPGLSSVTVTKLGIAFMFAIEASKKTNSLYIEDAEEEEEAEIFARTFGKLTLSGYEEEDAEEGRKSFVIPFLFYNPFIIITILQYPLWPGICPPIGLWDARSRLG